MERTFESLCLINGVDFFSPSSTAQDSRVLLRGAGKREEGGGPGGAGEGEGGGREGRSEDRGERRGEGRGGEQKNENGV
jgi:hypothetical protein